MESRIPGFYKMSVSERQQTIHEVGLITDEDYRGLTKGKSVLSTKRADKMIENVIGVMGLPIGLALNFLINGRDYVVPLVVEEPSIVAALSSAAKLARSCGGYTTSSTDPILAGQIQVLDVKDSARAQAAVLQRKTEILDLANSMHPKMVVRGGGAVDLEVHLHPSPDGTGDMMVVHLLVNTCDAMGANLVNTMCEGVASLVEMITGGRVLLRILSNLSDRALASARVEIPTEKLTTRSSSGESVRDGIVAAAHFAVVDPYRAATHNKGVMNGVDAVAIATGNDWRALEAAAHAYAARGSAYTSLTSWTVNAAGNLVGTIDMPMKVGTVGGSLQSNPAVAMNHRILGVKSATELAEVMAAVGLAQNFGALRALATDGIQQGHMTLHARSVTATAGAEPDIFNLVVERLLDSGDIKVWRAREIIDELRAARTPSLGTGAMAPGFGSAGRGPEHDGTARIGAAPRTDGEAVGYGKVILLGEHSVVYGRHAIAAPLSLTVRARVEDADDGIGLIIPKWGVEQRLHPDSARPGSFLEMLRLVLRELGLGERAMQITIQPDVPRAVGLGSSAAMAVAIVRAIDQHFAVGLTDEQVSRIAYECEKIAHGTPSGIDNTVSTYGRPILFRRGPQGQPSEIRAVDAATPLPIVIGMTGVESLTAATVGRVRSMWEAQPQLYEHIFDSIDALALQAVSAVEEGDLDQLGSLMNICQGQLNALQVSSPQVEELVQVARRHGALGAKLTGGGGGGAVIALCPTDSDRVVTAMRDAGYEAMEVSVAHA